MPREKPAYREILDRLDEAFPGRELIQQKELAKFLGVDVRTVKRHYSECKIKQHSGYCKTKIARALAD